MEKARNYLLIFLLIPISIWGACGTGMGCLTFSGVVRSADSTGSVIVGAKVLGSIQGSIDSTATNASGQYSLYFQL